MKRRIIAIFLIILLIANPVFADTYYYFSTDGDDSKDCLSWANRCYTVERMNDIWDSLPDPLTENIYILLDQNDSWDWLGDGSSPDFESTESLTCSYGACEDDYLEARQINTAASSCTYRVYFGACNSSGTYLGTKLMNFRGVGTLPIFDWHDYEVNAGGDPWDRCGIAFGGWRNDSIDDESNCMTIENIYVKNINSQAICLSGDNLPWPGAKSVGFVARWNKVVTTLSQAILLSRSTDFDIYDNFIDDSIQILDDYCDELDGTSIALVGGNYGGKVRGNTIVNSWGEGIGVFYNYNDGNYSGILLEPVLIEGNYVVNNKSAAIHPTASLTISRWNLQGLADYNDDGVEPYWRCTKTGEPPTCYESVPNCSRAASAGNAHEAVASDSKAIVQHSTVYGSISWGDEFFGGFGFTHLTASPADTYYGRIKYNTSIDNEEGFYGVHVDSGCAGNHEVKYNVGGRYDMADNNKWCRKTGYGTNPTWDDNHWESQPNDPDCVEASPFTYADPDLESTIGYRWPTDLPDAHNEQETDSVTYRDFRPKSTSPLIDKGGNYTTVHANDACNGVTSCGVTTLRVTYGFYFYEGDKIAIDTPTNIATISSIDYTTDPVEITLVTSVDRDDGDDIWVLPYDFGNRQQRSDSAYYGLGPDLGAIEWAADLAPEITQPQNGAQNIDHTQIITLQITRKPQQYHSATQDEADWRVCEDSGCSIVVWSSMNDTTNLLSINIPADTLEGDMTYYVNVATQNNDGTYGDVDSAWGSSWFKTGAQPPQTLDANVSVGAVKNMELKGTSKNLDL